MAKLELLTIPTPCSASWDAMTGDATVRHCRECHLDVFNLSEMTREQAERTVADHEGHVCVRFWRRPDGTVITQDCAPLKGEARPCVPRIAAPHAHAPAHPHAPATMAMADPVRPSGNPNPPPPITGPAPVERPVLMMGMPPPPPPMCAFWEQNGTPNRDTIRAEVLRAIRSAFDADAAEEESLLVETIVSAAAKTDREASCPRCQGPLWIPAEPLDTLQPPPRTGPPPAGSPEAKREKLLADLTPVLSAAFDAKRAESLLRGLKRLAFPVRRGLCPHCHGYIATAIAPPDPLPTS